DPSVLDIFIAEQFGPLPPVGDTVAYHQDVVHGPGEVFDDGIAVPDKAPQGIILTDTAGTQNVFRQVRAQGLYHGGIPPAVQGRVTIGKIGPQAPVRAGHHD